MFKKPPSIKRVALGCITLTVLWLEPKDIINIANCINKSIELSTKTRQSRSRSIRPAGETTRQAK